MMKKIFIWTSMILLVILQFSNAQSDIISVPKAEYNVGETVFIDILQLRPDIQLEIVSPTNIYRYLGMPDSKLRFIPRDPGIYEVRVKDYDDSILQVVTFSVKDPTQQASISQGPVFSKFRVKNSKNDVLAANVRVYDKESLIVTTDTFEIASLQKNTYSVELDLGRKSVEKIFFRNVNFDGNFNLGFEELDNDAVDLFWKNTNKVYAIDPTQIEFQNATVTAVAEGYELWKCAEYNFTEQKCYGDYIKVMDLVPGQEYNFTLTPKDPQFTEQTSQTQGCACSGSCQNSPGASSQCTATCNDYCDVNFTVPPGAISGWLEKVHYDVSITIGGTGDPISGSHTGRLDKDTTPNSANDVQIGSSTTTTTTSVTFENNNLDDTGSKSFDDVSCSTFDQGYCTWKPYLTSDYTCQGSRKTCDTTISLTLINYTWNYTEDTTAPTINLGNPVNNSFSNTRTNTFFYTPDDNLALQNCSIYINGVLNQTNGTLTEGQQTSFTVTNMQDTEHSWYITCYDTSLNLKTSGTKYLNVDATNPTIDFIDPTPPNNTFLDVNSFTINVSHTEANPDTLTLYWDGSPESQSYSSSFTELPRSGLSDATYSYYVWVNDSAGNENETGTRYVTIDTVDPSVALNEPPHDTWITYNEDIVFNYTPTDNNLNNCSLYGNFTDSGLFEENQTDTSVTSGVKNSFQPVDIADGFYVWNVLCYDKAGRSNFASSNYSLKVDGTEPSVTLLGPNNDTKWNVSNLVQFNYSVTDNFGQITNCTLEAISNITTYTFEDLSVETGVKQDFNESLSNNKYNWTIRCTDPAGNAGFPGYYNLTVDVGEDTVGPSIALNNPDNNNWTNVNNITLVYTPNDQSDINNCSLYVNNEYNQTDVNVENTIKNNFTLNNTAEGTYSWFVNCTDNSTAHNSEVSSLRTFNVDQTPPQTFLSYPENYFNSTWPNINFTWYSLDNLASQMFCDLRVNDTIESSGQLTNNDTLVNKSVSLADGGHYWNVTCRDLAYNYDTSLTRTLTVDTVSPVVDLSRPENNNVTLDKETTFYYTPSDNTSGLSECRLYIDNVLNKTDGLPLNNQENNFAVNFSSGVYEWQINCTDVFGNLGNSTVRILTVDLLAPETNSFTASPETVDLGEFVELTVNVTDNFGVDTVIAEITNPAGTATNYTMDFLSGDLYNLTYTDTTLRGTYTVNIISNDTNTLSNISKNYYFFVRAGITLDKVYYDRGETVFITGGGFDSGDNVSINITDPDGIPAIGSPITNIIANSSGGFETTWNISSVNGQATGNYTVKAFDSNSPGQSGQDYAYLVRKAIAATKTDKNTPGTFILSDINESEDTRSTITTTSNEDLINMTWGTIVPDGQTISDVRFYVEHIESSNNNLFIEWWNSTAQIWEELCTINANTVSETVDSCDLNDEVFSSSDTNNIRLQITDNNNYGSSIGAWTNIDLVYIEVEFTTLLTDKETYEQGENVTITGTRWPPNEQLTLNFTQPGGVVNQETTTTNANGDFSQIYQVPYDGALGRYNVTVYVTDNPDDTDETFFFVIKRNSSITTDKIYYGRRETVFVNGTGFSSSGNVTVLIYDAKNVLRVNDSTIASDDTNGTIKFNWTLPFNYDGYYGPHRVIARDSNYSNLNGTANITVGIITTNATKIQNAQFYDDTARVNQSDNVSATLAVYDVDEDQIRFEFLQTAVQNNILTNMTVYIEHNETQNFDPVLEWWNDTTWVDVCRIPFTNTEQFDSCDLISFIDRAPRTENITLKITDNQTDFGVPGQNWTWIDYIYLVTWTELDNVNPTIEVLEPLPDFVYNYSQTVTIRVNISENVEVDTVTANVTWPQGSQVLTLIEVGTNYYGEGIYEGTFSSTTDLEIYNVTFFVNDTSTNFNNTEKSNFSIESPDLTSSSEYLSFSKDIPVEGENITINLTIFNEGNRNASAFTVRFYDGNYTTGKQINGDITVQRLDIGENITVNTTWNATIGTHNIQAAIDTPIPSGGVIWEINESNNIVNKKVTVPSYNLYLGNTSGLITLLKSTNESKYSWNISTGGNIYVVETGSQISWFDLQALGRNTTNISRIDDFYEADVALRIENYTDSINHTYTENNQPIFEKDVEIYESIVRNIAHINSTNTSSFQTGILWDTSDGNTQYNGTQDIIFTTQVNKKKPGKYGIVDYEIRVPATLDNYKIGSGTVSFYTEIR